MDDLLEKLEAIYQNWLVIADEITQPDVISDMKRYIKLNKDYKDLIPVVDAYKEYKNIVDNIANTKEIISTEKDEDFRELAKSELDVFLEQKESLEEKIRILLLPSDPQDSKNAQVEIRAGTGGDEASIFAGDLFRMYQHFADKKGWKVEVLSMTEGTVGGFKEIVFEVSGEQVYGLLKYESGVHRVQRVPQTESQGRV
ncbi:MAG TPA: PCRF domain-containing protein, partial [Bacteroidales bacterium]|nr:PCRF domain-containing protein [Bacteroidales bacterium]